MPLMPVVPTDVNPGNRRCTVAPLAPAPAAPVASLAPVTPVAPMAPELLNGTLIKKTTKKGKQLKKRSH